MKLIKCPAPIGQVEEEATSPVLDKNGWKFQGVYIGGEYYERATKGNKTEWYKLADEQTYA